MLTVDAHCDTITRIMETGEELRKNSCHIDIERMKDTGAHVQFFAAFIHPSYGQAYAAKRALAIIDKLYEQIELNKDSIMLCHNYNEIKNAHFSGKIAAILSIEGGDALQGSLSSLRMFYKLGVRSICLTWNHRNEIADGVAEQGSGGGLTAFGKNVVNEMNRLGMIVDVSHIAEKGFWDVLEASGKPIIASHSNARKLCRHKRNLNDAQLLAIKRNGGAAGINFYPGFIKDSGSASLKDIISHIDYISGLIGTSHVGFGADFDGIDTTPVDVTGIESVENVINGLLRLNYNEQDVKAIAGGNFIRIINDIL